MYILPIKNRIKEKIKSYFFLSKKENLNNIVNTI